ncbi:13329_t:CDS:1, partial [Dentiscutata heterogama]
IEKKWDLEVNKSIVSYILKTSKQKLENTNVNFNGKYYRTVTYPELDLVLK